MSMKDSEDVYASPAADVSSVSDEKSVGTLTGADNVRLAQLGYKSEFRREFSVRFQETLHEIHT